MRAICGPNSSYSFLVIQNGLKLVNVLKIDPPIQVEFNLFGGTITLVWKGDWTKFSISLSNLS